MSEMSVFYYDLLVDYLTALIKQGNYTAEDVVVFNDVLGKSILMLIFNVELFSFEADITDKNRQSSR